MTPRRTVWSLLLLAPLLSGCSMADLAGLRIDTSPSGGQVVFLWSTSAGQEDDAALAVVRTDGTGFRWIPEGKDGTAPAWSPDGRWIAFSRGPTAGRTARALYLYDVAAQTTRLLSPDGGVPMVWREDSQRLFTIRHTRDGTLEALWLKLTGEPVFRILLPFRDYSPFASVWWPHTDEVAVIGNPGTTPYLGTFASGNVYVVGPGEVQQITQAGDIAGLGLASDGRRLFWARSDDRTTRIRLYSYDRATRAIRTLEPALGLGALQTDPGFRPYGEPFISFSPSGSRLILSVQFRGREKEKRTPFYQGVYSTALDGSDLRLVRRSRQQDDAFLIPRWTRDGKHIVVLGNDQKQIFLASHSADGSRRKTLVSVPIPTPTPTPR